MTVRRGEVPSTETIDPKQQSSCMLSLSRPLTAIFVFRYSPLFLIWLFISSPLVFSGMEVDFKLVSFSNNLFQTKSRVLPEIISSHSIPPNAVQARVQRGTSQEKRNRASFLHYRNPFGRFSTRMTRSWETKTLHSPLYHQ